MEIHLTFESIVTEHRSPGTLAQALGALPGSTLSWLGHQKL